MNGVPKTTEERVEYKRKLETDLSLIRTQKAEVLRCIQQIAKKQKTAPIKTLSPEERRQVEEAEHRHKLEAIWAQCSKLVAELLKNQNVNTWFGRPVDLRFAPNYYELIKTPMDLGTIKSKVDGRMYETIYQFRDDVRLVWANCRTYNSDPNGPVRKYGDTASDKFERRWVQLTIEVAWETECLRHGKELERIEAEAKSLPEKLKEVEAELEELTRKAEAQSGPAAAPGNGRDMTFEEKRKLSHSLGQLPGEGLARVLEIIAEGPSAPTATGAESEEEYELDIDALDPETLWALQTYVESMLAEAATKQPGAAGTLPSANAAGGGVQKPAPGAKIGDSEEVEASRGGTVGEDGKKVTQGGGGGGHDLTTYISATGPGAQPQILKGTGQKKEVQLQNANAWAALQGGNGGPAANGHGETAAGGRTEGEGGEEEDEDEDNLWSEFQGREAEQTAAEAEKKRAEEAAKAKAAAEADAKRKAVEEEEAAQKATELARAEAEKRSILEQKEREKAELASINGTAAAVGGGVGAAVGLHDSAADLAAIGLAARPDGDGDGGGEEEDDDDAMEEI